MKYSAMRRGLLAGISLWAFCGAAQAAAQGNADGEEIASTEADQVAGNTIVVPAQFREQRLQDTPLAITAVDAAQLEAKNQTNLAQAADAASNNPRAGDRPIYQAVGQANELRSRHPHAGGRQAGRLHRTGPQYLRDSGDPDSRYSRADDLHRRREGLRRHRAIIEGAGKETVDDRVPPQSRRNQFRPACRASLTASSNMS